MEAEYVATLEVVKELIFAKQLVESIGLKVKLPMVTKVNNVGAIYLMQNPSSQRTKHINVTVMLPFCMRICGSWSGKSGVYQVGRKIEAEIMTKNTTNELFEKHKMKLVG
jgi:hypothetical protein